MVIAKVGLMSRLEWWADKKRHSDVHILVGIAGLLAASRRSRKRFQDAGRGPGPAAYPMGELWAMMCINMGSDVHRCGQQWAQVWALLAS